MAGAFLTPAIQIPPSPQESTNWQYPIAGKAMRPEWPNLTSRVRRSGLKSERERLLEQVLDARQELGAVGPVEDAVVAHEREHHLVARDDLALVVHGGLLGELADGEDRRPRRGCWSGGRAA